MISDSGKICDQLKDLLHVEGKIIQRHIDRHKWFQHIPDKNAAVIDFVEKYGWLMREIYCENLCPKKGECHVFKTVVIPNSKS
jgi:hypothetical protein